MHPRHRPAARGEAVGTGEIVLALLQMGDDHRRLGLPVELEEDRTPVLDRLSELGRAHRRRPVEDGLHRRHVGRLVPRMSLQRVEHDGDDQRRRDAMLVDEVEEPVGSERLHHVERSARQQHGRDERHRRVRQRRGDRDPQVVGELPLGHLDPRHRLPHAMGHQHTLGASGRAAGVDHRCTDRRARRRARRAATARTGRRAPGSRRRRRWVRSRAA